MGDHDGSEARRVEHEELTREGNRLMLSGSAIGAATVASAVLLGATCPLCIVGVPALIGFGAYQRVRGELIRRELEKARAARSDEPAPER